MEEKDYFGLQLGQGRLSPSFCQGLASVIGERDRYDTKRRDGQKQHPAESGFLRFYYRNRRPTWSGWLSNQAWAWATGLGLTSSIMATLQVKDRRDGRLRSTVLVPVHYEGERYLASMLGDGSEWVQNVRAAGGEAFMKRGRTQPVTLIEVSPKDRAPILKAWRQIATSGRKHLQVLYDAPVSAFEAIATDYPVFRIDMPALPGF